jgi:hypothetical protein
MITTNTTPQATGSEAGAGGFAGDPAEAFRPQAAGGCCGSTTAGSITAGGDGTAAGACCGSVEDADAADSCCAPAAKTVAVANGAGCCG